MRCKNHIAACIQIIFSALTAFDASARYDSLAF
jgi:hypothetical protein